MAQDNKDEEKFDFTAEGEALGYISLAQARLLAMQTARETPGDYGDGFSGIPMVFAIVESGADEDYYNVILEIKPSGQFTGIPGREQFFVTKEGEVALRQVLRPPSARGKWPLSIIIPGVALVVGAVAIGGVVIASGGGDSVPVAAVPSTPVAVVVIPTATTTDPPVPTTTATVAPFGTIDPTVEVAGRPRQEARFHVGEEPVLTLGLGNAQRQFSVTVVEVFKIGRRGNSLLGV